MVYPGKMKQACERLTKQQSQKPVNAPSRLNLDELDTYTTTAVINLAESITRRSR